MSWLARVCCLAVVLVGAAVARPSAEISRDARGQTVLDSSDPVERPRSISLALTEAYKGGIVPVALVYDDPEEGVSRPLRDTDDIESREDTIVPEVKKADEVEEKPKEKDEKQLSSQQDTRNVNKNSKLLDLEARENDENSEFGLGIQSRNKISEAEGKENIEKPFVYNIQPLSFYSTETKEEENIINYINKIKEMRENQIKFQAAKEKEERPVKENNEDAVVTEPDNEEDERPITRKIQHYEAVIKPMIMDHQMQAYSGIPQEIYSPYYPAPAVGPFPYPYQQNLGPTVPQIPQIIYIPNPFGHTEYNSKSGTSRIFEDYFPIHINNPFSELWTSMTNIVEYGPGADVCRKNKKARVVEDDATAIIDLPTQRIKLAGSKDESWPKFTRLKVRKGGVAIAGPGGIATAGSGGTAIVGPGGTAYTTREGTAVVGPGGRVVHVPGFPIYAKDDGSEMKEFIPPPGSRTVAEGPIVYYDDPLDQDDMPDPIFPV